MNANDEMNFLRQKISYYDHKYYVDDEPEIEDYEYDALKRRLEELEKRFPELKSESSPLFRVGGMPSSKFSPVHHEVKMESLHDSFSVDEIRKFYDRISEKFENSEFVVEKKIDGLSLSVEYVNGKLFRASTRGDGITGEDVTENALTIKNLPHEIDDSLEYLEVRGECFVPRNSFLELVKSQEAEGRKVFKNPRNAAAGSIRQKNADVCKLRDLHILIFNVQQISGREFSNHSESLKFLEKLGLPVVHFEVCSNFDEIIGEINKINEERKDYFCQIDGAVIKLNDLRNRKIIGSTSAYPKWAEAFKYSPEVKKTKCQEIRINVGRTGILVPVCVFDPIEIDGTLVSKASLHNENFVLSKDIRIGDFVHIIKAGDIIPEVSKVEIDTSHERGDLFKMPNFCPSCGSKIVIDASKDVKIYRCMNENCISKIKAKILHFVSREAMDIDGFGEETFEILKNEVKNFIDIYKLNEENLKKYSTFRKNKISSEQETFTGFSAYCINKLGKNLIESIEKSKKNSLERLVYALGIPFVGKETANLLAAHFGNLDQLSQCNAEEILSIDGLGEITSKSVVKFFEKNENLVNSIKKLGLNIKYLWQTNNNINDNFKIYCITGKFNSYKRDEIIETLAKRNIRVSANISNKVSALICGTNAGSKFEKAKKMGIKIIYEDELDNILRNL